ncbi:MAG: RNA-binding cell elongation regulator Jag/EloR [Eubacteriales bacterium]|nr:RNA-binding cell elongation regulator Jag/EloR [Eubacteriales bacterium]
MIKEAIGIGDTELEAQADACRQLGVETYEAEFEIIQRAEKKVFGLFGGSKAKVRAFIKASPAEAAERFLKDVLAAMGLESVTMDVKESDENGVVFDLTGEDIGFVIGRRGETLDALQYLTGLVANHVDNSYYKVTVNTGDFREKREKTLEILGRKLAFKAVKTGYKTSLEPMNPYERRIIHTAVQKVQGAISWSEGENLNRHVVIGPDPKAPKNHRGRRGGKSFDRRPKRTNDVTVNDTPKREPLNEGEGAGLYGRIG